MSNTKKWEVTFSTNSSKNMNMKETVEDTSWQYAKMKMESKYGKDVKIKNYTPKN